MITENLSVLKIHKLTQEQYDRELAAGNIDETALYLTPDAEHYHSWNDLTDKPTVVIGVPDTLTWDGDPNGLEFVEGLGCKVSDVTPTLEDFINGATAVLYNPFEDEIESITYEDAVSRYSEPIFTLVDTRITIVYENEEGISPGIYFLWNGVTALVISLTINGYTGFATEKLDPAILPDNVATKESVDNLNTLVGDTSVSEQISTSIDGIDFPVDSVNGKTGDVTLSAADVGARPSNWLPTLDNLGITATASELNKLDGVTATTAELNYVDGVTSSIQTQLDGKQATITGGASTIASSNLTASRALVSNSSGKVAVSAVTSTELGYLDGVTSAIQTQLNGKAPSGYGLGLATGNLTQYSTVAQVNAAKSAGWYECYASSPLCDGYVGTNYGGLLVIPSMWNVTQFFFCREYYNGYLKRFCNDDGTWQPWEWVNPPMLPNTEYRTTEKYNGSSVFVKYIPYGYLAAGTHTIAHSISGISSPVDMIIHNGIYGPVMGSQSLYYGFDQTNVSLTLPWAAGDIGYVLKYTK